MSNTYLFVCNTYMQLINYINLKYSFFKDYSVDIILTDHSIGAKGISNRLDSVKLFRKVVFVESKKHLTQNKCMDLYDLISVNIFSANSYDDCLDCITFDYAAIICCNIDLYIYAIYDKIKEKTRICPRCYYIEEGVTCYKDMEIYNNRSIIRLSDLIRRILKKDEVRKQFDTIYCYYPDFFSEYFPRTIRMPLLSENIEELIVLLNYIFNYKSFRNKYNYKYIFLASSSDIDNRAVGEYQLINKIAEYVGKENILIKLHPRDDRTIYQDMGIPVCKDFCIPWELIQANNNFSDKTFISLCSSGLVTATAILNDNIEAYYLYPIIKRKNATLNDVSYVPIKKIVEKLQANGKLLKFKFIDEENDLKELLS